MAIDDQYDFSGLDLSAYQLDGEDEEPSLLDRAKGVFSNDEPAPIETPAPAPVEDYDFSALDLSAYNDPIAPPEEPSFVDNVTSGQGKVLTESTKQAVTQGKLAAYENLPDPDEPIRPLSEKLSDVWNDTGAPEEDTGGLDLFYLPKLAVSKLPGMESYKKGTDLAGTVIGHGAERLGKFAAGQYEKLSGEDIGLIKETAIESIMGDIKKHQDIIEGVTPENLTFMEQGVRGGVTSLAQNVGPMTLGLVASAVTRNPAIGTAISTTPLSAMAGLDSRTEARLEGLSVEAANAFGARQGGFELLTELVPDWMMNKMVVDAGKGAVKNFGKEFLQQVGAELGAEQVNGLMQSADKYLVGLDKEMEAAKTPVEKTIIQLKRQAMTFVSTLVAAGAQSGAITGAGAILQKPQQAEAEITEAAFDPDVDLETMVEIAEAMMEPLALEGPTDTTLKLDAPTPKPVTMVADSQGNVTPTTESTNAPDAGFSDTLYVGPDGVAKEKVSSYGAADRVTIPDPNAVPPGKTPVKKAESGPKLKVSEESLEKDATRIKYKKQRAKKPEAKALPTPPLASEQDVDYYVDENGKFQTVVGQAEKTAPVQEGRKEGQSAKKQSSPTMDAQRRLAGTEVKGVTLPENLQDPRLKRDNYRFKLREMVNKELVEGGGIAIIRDDFVPSSGDQKMSRRTPSVNPKWYQNMDSDVKLPVVAARSAVDRALKGEKLGEKQVRFVEAMLNEYQDQRVSPDIGELEFKKEQRAQKRQARKDVKDSSVKDTFEDYDPEAMEDITPKSGSYDNQKAAYRALEQKKKMKDMATGFAEKLERYSPVKNESGDWVLRADVKKVEPVKISDDQKNLDAIASGAKLPPGSLKEVVVDENTQDSKFKNTLTLITTALGKKVVFFESNSVGWQPNGFIRSSDSGTIYINVKADRPLHVVMGHEILHAIKIDNTKAYERVMEGLDPLIDNYQGYKDWVNEQRVELGSAPLNDAKVREEMAADMLGDSFDNPQFWADLKKQSPTLYENILQTIQEYLNQFAAKINERHLKGTSHFKDINKARIELTKLVRQAVNDSAQAETKIDKQANEAAASITNDTPLPTEAQIDAENYKKGHVSFNGLDVAIENPVGSIREGKDKNGKSWRTKMANHYGYVKSTEGNDGDAIDVFMGPNEKSDRVFVFNQVDPKSQKFDEHKVMLGFDFELDAIDAYLEHYPQGWEGRGDTTEMSMGQFKDWLNNGDHKSPAKVVDVNYSPSQNEKGSTPGGKRDITEDEKLAADLEILDNAVPDITTEKTYEKTEKRIRSRLEQSSAAGLYGGRSLRIVDAQSAESSSISQVPLGESSFVTEDDKFTQAEIREQAKTLIANAKRDGYFWDTAKENDVANAIEPYKVDPESQGAEHDVFITGVGDEKLVIRNTANGVYGPTKDTSPAQYIQRLEENNEVFPGMQMQILGVSEDAEGNAVIWTAQEFVEAREFNTEAELEAALGEKGWVKIGSPHVDTFNYKHTTSGAIIQDAHTGNVLVDKNGNLHPIDVMIEKMPRATADEIVFSPQQDADSILDEEVNDVEIADGAADPYIDFPEMSAKRAWYEEQQRKFVDYLQAPKKTQRVIEKAQGGKVSEEMDFETAVVLLPGAQRAEFEDWKEQEFDVLREKITDSGLSFEEASEFLHARHAKEANAHLKQINPGIDALSGMSNEKAERLINAFQERYGEMTKDDIAKFSKDQAARYRKHKRAYDQAVRTPSLNAEMEALARKGMSKAQAQSIVDKIEAVPFQKRTQALKNRLVVAKRLAEGPIANNDDLSGMSNKDAQDILDKYKDKEKVQAIGEQNDKMNEDRINYLVDNGLISDAEAQAWRDNYDYYVPLQREDITQEGPLLGSRGFDVRGRPVKMRAGSKLSVDHKNMLAHIAAQHTSFIIKAKKNEAVETFYNLAKANPDPDLWKTDYLPPGDPRLSADGEVMRPESANDSSVVSFKKDGENVYLWINPKHEQGALMIRALTGIGKGASDLAQPFARLNRVLSQLNTTFSPPFILTNFLKDIQSAAYNLTDTELENNIKDVINPKAIFNSLAAIRSSLYKDGSHPDAKLFEEYRRAGGITGWMQSYDNIENHMEDIRREVSGWELNGKKVPGRQAVAKVFKFVSDRNSVVENAVRFSAYKVAREQLGLSPKQAAKLGKELTVDFNRKGEWGSNFNAFYMFWNAGVQGNSRILRGALNKDNKRIRKMMAGTMAFAAAVEIYNQWVSAPDDEDDESAYNKIRDQIGSRYFILMTGRGEDDYISFPLPWGYNVLHLAGQAVGGALARPMGLNPSGSVIDDTTRTIVGAMKSFNPMMEATLAQSLSPTVFDPMMRIVEEKDWHGGPLYPNFNPKAPNFRKYYSSASETSKYTAKFMHDTFVNEDTQEINPLFDWSPEWTDMGFEYLTGGAGKFFLKDLPKLGTKLFSGEATEAKDWPFLNKVYGKVGPTAIKSDYYEKVYQIANMESKLNAIRNDDSTTKREALENYKTAREATGPRARLMYRAKSVRKLISNQKKLIANLEDRGEDARAKAETEKMLQNMRNFSTLYNKTIYGDPEPK